ncbi:MAG: 3-dehydroquinate synthase, partial [Gammaproteobacteria bacterium]|nr:3-dehydroquinate synthase [Gammaproteobacteria bacterium]
MQANKTRTPATGTIHWQRFSVPYEYPVYFTEHLFDPENTILRDTLTRLEPEQRHRCVVFLDDGLGRSRPSLSAEIEGYARHFERHIDLVTAPVIIPGGEKIKSDLHFVEQQQQTLYDYHIDRHSFVIAVGGGAVLDAVGLVAATTHRGIRHIRIPTTVLAQNDSGVGVKNGVNLFGAKNYVGTFAPPFAVINDLDFIYALEPRDRIAGIAEAVKVALIRDARFFAWLERQADDLATHERQAMADMIRRCAELHMHQIAHGGDPFENGSARPLDYGHWSAHKLESLTRYHLRHGEAVAIGIALDARYSVLCGRLPAGQEERICFLL